MTAGKIALVKGEGTLPPLTHKDCSLVVRAAFLPCLKPPPCAVTQLVGWFDPETRQPSLIEQIDGDNRKTLLWRQHADSAMVTDMFSSPWCVSFSCCAVLPTPLPVPPPLPVPIGVRTLQVALADAHGKVWHDGYLAHYSDGGDVLSLVSTPGEARLYVPQTPITQRGIELAAVALPQPAHYLRLCLRAQLAAFCRQHEGKLTLALDDTSLPAMICVVLLSSLRAIAVNAPQFTPAWTRLLQNLGVLTGQNEAMLAVSALSQLVPAAAARQIAQDINSQAAIIPAKVMRQV